MKYVQRIRTPSGEVYLYLRKRGLPSIRLSSPEGSPELEAEVAALVASLTLPKARVGTIRAALRAYELGPDYKALAVSTRYEYGLILKELAHDLGDLPLTVVNASFVKGLRDAWAERGHRAANVRLQVLKNVLAGPIIEETIPDPFGRIAQVRRPANAPEPHPVWPNSVLETVMAAAVDQKRFGLARAVAIARYTGARREDVTRIPRSARAQGRFAFLSGKRRVPVDIREEPELTRWLDATPDTQPLSNWQATRAAAKRRTLTTPTTLVFNRQGKPYTADGLALELGKLIRELHAREMLGSDRYDFHGLRHTRGVELALAGATDAEGAAQLGQSSPASFTQYRRQADRVRMSDNAAVKVAELRTQQNVNSVGTPAVKRAVKRV